MNNMKDQMYNFNTDKNYKKESKGNAWTSKHSNRNEKHSPQAYFSRFDASKETISELEHRSTEITTKTRRIKRMKQKQIIKISEEGKEYRAEKISIENFLKVVSDTKPQNQEAQKHYGE